MYTLDLFEGFCVEKVRKGVVCEVGSDVKIHPSASHLVWKYVRLILCIDCISAVVVANFD